MISSRPSHSPARQTIIELVRRVSVEYREIRFGSEATAEEIADALLAEERARTLRTAAARLESLTYWDQFIPRRSLGRVGHLLRTWSEGP